MAKPMAKPMASPGAAPQEMSSTCEDVFNNLHLYQPFVDAGLAECFTFGKIVVRGVGNKQENLCVQVYLDDTSNFGEGLGNTR